MTPDRRGVFATTRWSTVNAAGHLSAAQAATAFAELCEIAARSPRTHAGWCMVPWYQATCCRAPGAFLLDFGLAQLVGPGDAGEATAGRTSPASTSSSGLFASLADIRQSL